MNWLGILAMGMSPAGGGGTGAAPQSSAFMFIWLGLMVALFYFMLIRPQKRREKEPCSERSRPATGFCLPAACWAWWRTSRRRP